MPHKRKLKRDRKNNKRKTKKSEKGPGESLAERPLWILLGPIILSVSFQRLTQGAQWHFNTVFINRLLPADWVITTLRPPAWGDQIFVCFCK